MRYHDDPAAFEQRLLVKLESRHIHSTLAFAGLYQITYEMVKQLVLGKVRDYFSLHAVKAGDALTPADFEQYRTHVLELAPGKPFRASLLWLVDMEAVTADQADRLAEIYSHRNAIAHELLKFVFDPAFDPDIELLTDAVMIAKDLHRFWATVEVGVVSFDHIDEVDPEDVIPLSWILLQCCLQAYLDGLPSSDHQFRPGPEDDGEQCVSDAP